MSKIAKILIAGPIGTFMYEGQKIHGIELEDVVAQVNKNKDAKTLWFQYDTPGGVKETGDAICTFIESLKNKYELVSEQIGLVASIGTKPYLVADRRIATRGKKFMVHNPWTLGVSGDGDYVLAHGTKLKENEDELAGYYSERTGLPDEGIRPLMKKECEFGDELAVDLGFATELQEAPKIAAYMKKENEEKFGAVVAALKEFFLGKTLALVAELEDGTKISFGTEDLSKLDGATATTVDESGAPTQVAAQDKVYILKDGRKVTVTAGKVTSVEGTPAQPPAESQETTLALKLDQVLAALASKESLEAAILAKVDAKLVDLKNQIKSTHVPPTFDAVKKGELAALWDSNFKENKIAALKRDHPEDYKQQFFAKYGKMPNM